MSVSHSVFSAARVWVAVAFAVVFTTAFLFAAVASVTAKGGGADWPPDREITFCLALEDGTEELRTATVHEGGMNQWWLVTTTGPEFLGGNHYPPCANSAEPTVAPTQAPEPTPTQVPEEQDIDNGDNSFIAALVASLIRILQTILAS